MPEPDRDALSDMIRSASSTSMTRAGKQKHPNVRRRHAADIEREMDASHNAVLQALARLSSDDLDRAGKHPRGTPYTVRDVLLRYPAHDLNHTEQIASIRARLGP